MNFVLWKHHGLSIGTIENMMPFERDVYIMLLREWIEEEKERIQQEKLKAGHG